MATESNSSPDIRLHKRGENSKKLCVIASDHVGVLFKSVIVDFLKESPAGEGWDILDVGPHDTTRVGLMNHNIYFPSIGEVPK